MEEIVELLQNKVRVLETLIKCKDSEIDILKNCLQEIGTQIRVDDIKQPDFSNLQNPLARVEYRRTELFLQKAYTYSLRDHKLLDDINDALRKVNKDSIVDSKDC